MICSTPLRGVVLKIPSFSLGDRGSLARKLVVETLGSTGVRMLGTLASFLVGVQLARYMGPAEYGRYGTVMALVAMLATAGQLGLPQLATRDISVFLARNSSSEAKGVLVWLPTSVLLASGIISLVSTVIYIVWTGEHNGPTASTYYWGFGNISLFALGALGVGMLRGYEQIVSAQFFDAILRPGVFALFLFLTSVASVRLNATLAMSLQAATGVVTVGLCFWSLWRLTPPHIKRAKAVAQWRQWAAFATTMTGNELLRILDGQYAILIFGMVASLHDVGIFRVSLSISIFVLLPGTVIATVIMPYAAQLHSAGDIEKLQMIATNASLVLFVSGLLATLAVALFGQPAITLAFGAAYQQSWLPLLVIAAAYAVSSFFGSCTVILLMTGCERAVTIAYTVGLVVGVGLTLALYGVFGITAAAVAMGVAGLVRGVMMWKVARDRLSVDTSAGSAIYNLIFRRFGPPRTA